jgi:hypothetical protein
MFRLSIITTLDFSSKIIGFVISELQTVSTCSLVDFLTTLPTEERPASKFRVEEYAKYGSKWNESKSDDRANSTTLKMETTCSAKTAVLHPRRP